MSTHIVIEEEKSQDSKSPSQPMNKALIEANTRLMVAVLNALRPQVTHPSGTKKEVMFIERNQENQIFECSIFNLETMQQDPTNATMLTLFKQAIEAQMSHEHTILFATAELSCVCNATFGANGVAFRAFHIGDKTMQTAYICNPTYGDELTFINETIESS